MAGQPNWGNAGDANNAYIVNPNRQKELYMKATFPTIVEGLNNGRMIEHVQMEHNGKDMNRSIAIGNSSAVWQTDIRFGNEIRLTELQERTGMGTYGDTNPLDGSYDSYKHSVGWINEINSEAMPLPGRNSLKQVKEVINDPKSDLMVTAMQWATEEIDYEFVRAMLMGASRGILSDAQGALNVALYNQSAGQQRSCYNFYVPQTGLVTQSPVYATYEGAVATALDTLADNALYGYDYAEHRKLSDMIKNLKFKGVTVGGKRYRAVVIQDPDLTARLTISSSTYTSLNRDGNTRGAENPALFHLNPIELDGILYIPYERLKAFRPTTASSVPVYGPGNSVDPRTYTNSSKNCLSIVLSSGAVLRGVDRKMNVLSNVGAFNKGVKFMLAWDEGFYRREEFTKDGTTDLDNTGSLVMCHYDPGVEVAFNA